MTRALTTEQPFSSWEGQCTQRVHNSPRDGARVSLICAARASFVEFELFTVQAFFCLLSPVNESVEIMRCLHRQFLRPQGHDALRFHMDDPILCLNNSFNHERWVLSDDESRCFE